jgi:spermidine synthase
MLLVLVIACFALSGFSALLYQTAWMRLFAVSLGTSEVAVAVVLAGYMAGLALGAAVAARYIARVRRPVLVYGLLEAAIALVALAMPQLVEITGDIYARLAGGQVIPPDAGAFGQQLYFSLASILVLLIPTGLMGATLPLLASYAVTSNRNLGQRIAILYSMNTVGAVAGTLAAGFWLLPALGLGNTVKVGAVVNLVVFVLAVLAARRAGHTQPKATKEPGSPEADSARARFILPLIALSGVLSFIYEVLWTRMLSHVLGSSVYAFATMLAAFLSGIAIGAAVAAPLARNPRRAAMLFAACQFAVAVTSALVYWGLERSVPSGASHVLFAFLVILPSTIFIGATYPFAVRVHAGGAADAGRSSAVVYSWNTVGAVVGALAAGFFIVPALGFEGTAKLAVSANIFVGMVVLVVATTVPGWRPLGMLRMAATTLGMLLVVVLFQPGRPDALVYRTFFGGSGEVAVRETFFSVGRSSTILLTENSSRFDLASNGLPEAQIEFRGAPPIVLSQRWLGQWPGVLRPESTSMLVVGLGGGVVLEGVPDAIETLHVVELEPEVVAANRRIGPRRYVDPMAREATHIALNDARNALRLTNRSYDAIVSQPSHPWTAGASHLFTREFFALVKERLARDGLFVQWMNAEFLDEALLRRLVATLLAEFEYVRVYQPSSLALHFIASNEPFDRDDSAESAAMLLVDETGAGALAGTFEPVTDDDNRMAMDSNVQAAGLGVSSLSKIIEPVDALLDVDDQVRSSLTDRELLFVASRLLLDGQEYRTRRLADSVEGQALGNLVQAMIARHQGQVTRVRQLLALVPPDNALSDVARFLEVADYVPQVTACPASRGTSEETRFDAVLEGWCAYDESDWERLAALEPRLRESVRTDLWAAHATWLRTAWRLHADDRRLTREALALIDGTIDYWSTPALYAQRAQAAAVLGYEWHYVESVAFFVRSINDRLWELDYRSEYLPANEYRWVNEQLQSFVSRMIRQDPAEVAGRTTVVLTQVRELQEYLANY